MIDERCKFFFLIALGLFSLQSCYYDSREDLYQFIEVNCDLNNVSYAADIEPLLASQCAYSGCHSSTAPAAGLDLSTHANAANAVLNGALIDRIEKPNGDAGQMPPSGKMNDCDINKIKEWTIAGAPNN